MRLLWVANFYGGLARRPVQPQMTTLPSKFIPDLAVEQRIRWCEPWCPHTGARFYAQSSVRPFDKLNARSLRENILLVEDELALEMSVGDRFRKEGYRVDSASDGETGVDLFVTNDTHLQGKHVSGIHLSCLWNPCRSKTFSELQ